MYRWIHIERILVHRTLESPFKIRLPKKDSSWIAKFYSCVTHSTDIHILNVKCSVRYQQTTEPIYRNYRHTVLHCSIILGKIRLFVAHSLFLLRDAVTGSMSRLWFSKSVSFWKEKIRFSFRQNSRILFIIIILFFFWLKRIHPIKMKGKRMISW